MVWEAALVSLVEAVEEEVVVSSLVFSVASISTVVAMDTVVAMVTEAVMSVFVVVVVAVVVVVIVVVVAEVSSSAVLLSFFELVVLLRFFLALLPLAPLAGSLRQASAGATGAKFGLAFPPPLSFGMLLLVLLLAVSLVEFSGELCDTPLLFLRALIGGLKRRKMTQEVLGSENFWGEIIRRTEKFYREQPAKKERTFPFYPD